MAIVMKGRKKVLLLITDDGHSFDQVLFYGNELTLLLFDVLTFCISDYIFTNYIVAGVITYLISEVSELCLIIADYIFTNYIVAGVITYLMSEVSELCHIIADYIFTIILLPV